MNHDLKFFCQEILSIIKNNRVSPWFTRNRGLCSNAIRFDDIYGSSLYSYLIKTFDGEAHPFNEGSFNSYTEERVNSSVYQNKQRLAFLEKYATEDE